MSVTATMSGRKKLEEALEAYRRLTFGNVAAANEEVGERLLELSQELVPVDTGALKESGYVKTTGTLENRETEVGYGHPEFGPVKRYSTRQGRDLLRYPYGYAGYVHLNPDNRLYHSGEDNFLLKPLLQAQDELRMKLRQALGVG